MYVARYMCSMYREYVVCIENERDSLQQLMVQECVVYNMSCSLFLAIDVTKRITAGNVVGVSICFSSFPGEGE